MPKVLVVDDDENLRSLYKKNLEARNYTVETAVNGEDALAKVQQFNPNIIILDVMMPKMSGIEVLKSLKNDENLKNIPVVMLTGVSEVSQIKEFLELGAKGYIQKGSSIEEIDRRLRLFVSTS